MDAVSPAALRAWLDGERPPVVVDVREPWEAEICRLPGSMLVPMSRLPAGADSLPDDAPLVMLCHHGVRSAQVGVWLERAGRREVFNLTGGIDAWAREVDPGMATY